MSPGVLRLLREFERSVRFTSDWPAFRSESFQPRFYGCLLRAYRLIGAERRFSGGTGHAARVVEG